MALVVSCRTKYRSSEPEIILLSKAKHRQTMLKRLWMLPQPIQAILPKTTKGDTDMSQKETNFFNIDDMSQGIVRTLTDGITTRIFPGEKSMVSVVRIEPNAVGAIHSHPQEQWGLMLEGSAVRIQDGEEIKVKKGDFWVSPGGIEHGVIGGPDGAVILDVFSPPREEYTRPGSGFGTE